MGTITKPLIIVAVVILGITIGFFVVRNYLARAPRTPLGLLLRQSVIVQTARIQSLFTGIDGNQLSRWIGDTQGLKLSQTSIDKKT